ncbi:molybdopterin-dependent oxidoreductase [Halarcobacter ebronensis]|uniref:Molybdopterin oxidoreductase domain-containing protein n=1 Tax=Halarcobacter ebronensis TaxID=1462615 RepID=A0A4Q1AYT5_9BACT|nr:molybdopterin-dependent oxidoreductase [Halarcobacter ebronensis]QKF82884.1 putative molybdopterin-binding oxidoreductase [Halarcobacter ebronensis]RXK06901.1 hypothetical protein CRV07_05595 [Halarcobacter ebronensis]
MSLSKNSIACPLDCYDTCEALYENGLIKGNKNHRVTNGKLCINFANLQNENFLKTAYYENKEITLEESLNILVEKLKNTKPENTLFYKGAGNLGIMQSITKIFFASYGSVLTKGSLCDEIGGYGLAKGRGKLVNPPIENLINSDVIIVWGRNFSVSSPHMYNLVKDKTFITIDPIKTDIAKKSSLHLQLNPKTDHELALLLTRFAYMEDMEDEEFIKNNSNNVEDFFDLAKEKPLLSYEKTTGISLTDITKFFELIKNKKVAILIGLGVQKYYEGAQIIRTIDSFAAYIGVHNKDYGGVWYLDESAAGYEKQIVSKPKKKIPLPEVDFSQFDLVFIQGANPVVSAPNTKRIVEGLKNSFVVYFGTTLNDTAKYANLIIPASNFLTKGDVRLSYGHNLKAVSNAVIEKEEGTISEYELASFLTKEFSFENLKAEEEILNYYKNTVPNKSHKMETFKFIEELEIENLYENKEENQYYFITAKRKRNLNSQFESDDKAYFNPSSGLKEKEMVKLFTDYGEAIFEVALSEDVKENCILTYAGNKKANYLTPFKKDEVADSATLQEVLVTIDIS